MNTILWAAQAMLALAFLAHGLLFLFPPAALREMPKQMPFPAAFSKFIFIAESLGAVGLFLPGSTGILPWLTPLAAAGLVPIAAAAAVYHLSRREIPPAVVTTVLSVLAVFVAYARWVVIPL